jgi:hypothetical protein
MYANNFRINWGQTVRIKMTSPYRRMPMVCSLKPPFDAAAEHEVVAKRDGLSAARKADRCAVRREIESSRRPRRSPTDERGGGESRGRGQTRQHAQGISGTTPAYLKSAQCRFESDWGHGHFLQLEASNE